MPFSNSLSVLRRGIVQVKVTSFPLRTAARSVALSGRSSEGGWGAPGMPHPASNAAAVSAAIAIIAVCSARPRLSALLIAFSV
jgi:hypothetical protein